MNKLKFFFSISAVVILLSGCVTNKKYDQAIKLQKQCEDDLNKMASANDQLKSEIMGLQTASEAELQKKQKELTEKEKLLKEREKKLEDLKSEMTAARDAVYHLKRQVCDALKCFSPDELTVELRDGKLYVSLSDKLLFPSGSDALNERGKEAISQLAAVLKGSDLDIVVEGHTDSIPINTAKYKDNWDLSVHRATAVSRLLIASGLPSEKIIPSGRGEHHPAASNGDEQGRSQNRRTEIVLAPKLDKLWKLTEEPAGEQGAGVIPR